MRLRPAVLGLALLAGGCPVEPEPAPDLVVAIAADQVLTEVDERYLSFAVDTAQALGGRFWNPDPETAADLPEVEVDPYDFDRPELRALAAELGPAMLRIGGTAADTVHYDLSETPGTEAPEPYRLLLTRDDWARWADFAADLDLDLFFTLNVGPGPRDGDGAWVPDEARALMEHAGERDDPVVMWELGNEINGFLLAHGATLSAEQYAADLATARELVDQVAPGAHLGGPSSAYWPEIGDMTGFYPEFMPHGGHLLDVVTWHYYPQQSRRCPVASRPAGPEVMLDPAHLDEADLWSDEIEGLAAEHAPDARVWLGETGNAQCGGEPGVSDAWAGSFWWLDQLGLLAARGQGIAVRQTLSGSDYGLLDEWTLEPRPDYWVSVLHKRLMGQRVLAATSPSDTVRAYAHCAADGPAGAVAATLINLDEEPVAVGLELAGPVDLYLLTAPALDSREVSLNGHRLEAPVPDLGALAEPLEAAIVTLPARSLAFVSAPAADAAACR